MAMWERACAECLLGARLCMKCAHVATVFHPHSNLGRSFSCSPSADEEIKVHGLRDWQVTGHDSCWLGSKAVLSPLLSEQR